MISSFIQAYAETDWQCRVNEKLLDWSDHFVTLQSHHSSTLKGNFNNRAENFFWIN